MIERQEKRVSLEMLSSVFSKHFTNDSMLAVGGTTLHMNPMGLLRELIYNTCQSRTEIGSLKINNLDLVAGPLAALAVDLLCGAGLVGKVRAAYVAAEHLGLCPNFMKSVAAGSVKVWECGEAIFLEGLTAAAEAQPFGCTLEGLGSDIMTLNPDLKTFKDPCSGKTMLAVPPIGPDICFLHVPKADIYGNCCHQGPIYSDLLLAAATKRSNGVVIVSTEEIMSPAQHGHLDNETDRVTIPGVLVDHVIEMPGGAYPTACHGNYVFDHEAISTYLSLGKAKAEFEDWLKTQVVDTKPHPENPVCIGRLPETKHQPVEIRTDKLGELPTEEVLSDSYSGAELLVVRLSECVNDGDIGSAGANSPIPQAAIRLAQLTHAPNMTFLSSYSGFFCRLRQVDGGKEQSGEAHHLAELREKMVWSSFDARNLQSAECAMTSTDIFWLKRDVFFVSGLQFDQCGNVNLIGIGNPEKFKLRGPGTAGVALVASIASRLYLYAPAHEKRTIVDQVDFISGMGHPDNRKRRKDLGLPGAGPAKLMTPLCTFDFNAAGLLRLESLNPGVTVEEVLDRTGTKVEVPLSVPQASAPSREQLIVIRKLIDPDGILKKVKTT